MCGLANLASEPSERRAYSLALMECGHCTHCKCRPRGLIDRLAGYIEAAGFQGAERSNGAALSSNFDTRC